MVTMSGLETLEENVAAEVAARQAPLTVMDNVADTTADAAECSAAINMILAWMLANGLMAAPEEP